MTGGRTGFGELNVLCCCKTSLSLHGNEDKTQLVHETWRLSPKKCCDQCRAKLHKKKQTGTGRCHMYEDLKCRLLLIHKEREREI